MDDEFAQIDAERRAADQELDANTMKLQKCERPAAFALTLTGGMMTRIQTARASSELQELLSDRARLVRLRNEILTRWAPLKMARSEAA